jgi:spore maturation protein CgeB
VAKLTGIHLGIVGNRGGTNVGGCFERAAHQLGIPVTLFESREAMRSPAWLRLFNWRVRGKRPTRLNHFGHAVLSGCVREKINVLLATGLAPLSKHALEQLAACGVHTFNFLTDDPWNRAHRAPWFLNALPRYEIVFNPRRANIGDLQARGCRDVRYLPFAYDPELHFPVEGAVDAGRESDVLFIGGADRDRAPLCEALVRAGLNLALYGDYWSRFPSLAKGYRGYADPDTCRRATAAAKVSLCLVRKANRDGHTMRSLETAAIGACMLVEDTVEHRNLFGPEGEAVFYFDSIPQMTEKAAWLVARSEKRRELARALSLRITQAPNTYADRLKAMLEAIT